MAKSASPEWLSDSGTVAITRRSDLSILYRILCVVIRPLRPHLVAPKKKYPTGSPRLPKRRQKTHGAIVTEREVTVPPYLPFGPGTNVPTETESLWVYNFRSTHETEDKSQSQHRIFYFSGGGFQSPASGEHFKFCAHLAASLPHNRITLVSYPLSPHSPAAQTLPLLRRWLAQVLQDAAADDAVVTLAGDSSGANIALSLGLWCTGQLAATDVYADERRSLGRLQSVLVISPPTDMRNANPAAALVDPQDPVLGKRVADAAAAAWAVGGDSQDPYLSPNRADLGNLRASGVRINGIVGTADVLAPDALEFLDKCRREGVQGQWLVWEGQMHCFPLAACYGLREGKEARQWAVNVLRGVS
ncbi:Alpha/Beta hydrolase protein [Hypomontagnella submonticulosa]|nr:Alpha/Beta hydrolase protein [Hypomontagnella submonticulosa]